MNPPSQNLVEFFRDYVALSKGMRFDKKRAWWDEYELCPVLKPEESTNILTGWPAIQNYWDATRAALNDLSSSIDEIQTNWINESLAITTFKLRWKANMDGPFLGGGPLGALVRVTAATRLKPPGWRIFSYIEAHVDPMTYATKMAADQADDFVINGFGDPS